MKKILILLTVFMISAIIGLGILIGMISMYHAKDTSYIDGNGSVYINGDRIAEMNATIDGNGSVYINGDRIAEMNATKNKSVYIKIDSYNDINITGNVYININTDDFADINITENNLIHINGSKFVDINITGYNSVYFVNNYNHTNDVNLTGQNKNIHIVNNNLDIDNIISDINKRSYFTGPPREFNRSKAIKLINQSIDWEALIDYENLKILPGIRSNPFDFIKKGNMKDLYNFLVYEISLKDQVGILEPIIRSEIGNKAKCSSQDESNAVKSMFLSINSYILYEPTEALFFYTMATIQCPKLDIIHKLEVVYYDLMESTKEVLKEDALKRLMKLAKKPLKAVELKKIVESINHYKTKENNQN